MIVKIVPRKTQGSSFAVLARYITQDKKISGAESLAWADFHNVDATTLVEAIYDIVSTQRLAKGTRTDKTMHAIVSFPIGEVPGRAVLDDIEQTLMGSIGMSHHQRISAIHTDTSHLHLHLAVNKIDPVSHRNISPSFNWPKLQAAARELEVKHSLQGLDQSTDATIYGAIQTALADADCTWRNLQSALAEHGVQLKTRGRGLALIDRSGRVVKPSTISRDFSRAKLESRLGPFTDHHILPALSIPATAQAMEAHSGKQSFASWAREQLHPVIETALSDSKCDWTRLQTALAEHGVQLKVRGRGLTLIDRSGCYQVKASTISRDFSRAKLESRLGPFTDHHILPAALPVCRYQPAPSAPASRFLYQQYEATRKANMVARTQRFKDYAEYRTARMNNLKEVYGAQRTAAWNERGLDKRRRWLLLQRLKVMKAQEEGRIRTELAEMRERIKAETQTDSWIDYLIEHTEKGSPEAYAALRASRSARIAQKPDIGHPVIAGPRRPDPESVKRLPSGFHALKNGDISWSTDDGEKVILRGHQLFAIGSSAQIRQKTLDVGRQLFGRQAQIVIEPIMSTNY